MAIAAPATTLLSDARNAASHAASAPAESAAASYQLPIVVQRALDATDSQHFIDMLNMGQSILCCGYWRDEVAARLQHRVATELGIPHRRLGDVHLSNSSSRITSSISGTGAWGAVAVFYLDSPGSSRAALEHAAGGRISHGFMDAAPQNLIVVPEGEQLVHSAPHRVAWLHIRREGTAERSMFDYYCVAWVRANFVAPYDTESQRKLFRTITRYPRYWHGFIWSFIGMFFTVFACLPLAWSSINYFCAQEASPQPSPAKPPTVASLPTLLSHGGPAFMKHDPTRKGGAAVSIAGSEPMV